MFEEIIHDKGDIFLEIRGANSSSHKESGVLQRQR
jgi:hypothetical protein